MAVEDGTGFASGGWGCRVACVSGAGIGDRLRE